MPDTGYPKRRLLGWVPLNAGHPRRGNGQVHVNGSTCGVRDSHRLASSIRRNVEADGFGKFRKGGIARISDLWNDSLMVKLMPGLYENPPSSGSIRRALCKATENSIKEDSSPCELEGQQEVFEEMESPELAML